MSSAEFNTDDSRSSLAEITAINMPRIIYAALIISAIVIVISLLQPIAIVDTNGNITAVSGYTINATQAVGLAANFESTIGLIVGAAVGIMAGTRISRTNTKEGQK